MSGLYGKAGIEPSLQDLMTDEVTLLVMRRDRLSPETVWAHVNQARAMLRERALPPLLRCA